MVTSPFQEESGFFLILKWKNNWKKSASVSREYSETRVFTFLFNVSVNSKPDHPPGGPPGDSHILVAPRVGFSLLCLAQFARGVLNQSKSSIILKKARFLLCLLSSFHMFIYARSEQPDLVPIYTITNTQRIRIYLYR